MHGLKEGANVQDAPLISASKLQKLLRSIGLDRKETISWAMYDWANSAFATTIMAAVLPPYYSKVAGFSLPANVASAYWAYTTAIALFIIALISPILGAVADYMGAKKRFMGAFAVFGILFTASLYFIERGNWLEASILFIFANIGFSGANIFYDSLLPHIARKNEIDQISSAGYAVGYLGGGLLLLLNIFWIQSPQTFGIPDTATASRLAILSVAVWWAVFSIPVFNNVREPIRLISRSEISNIKPLRAGFRRLFQTLRDIPKYRQLALFLAAFWFYNDGINTIIKMATIYGTEIGIEQSDLIGALVLTQFAGIPFTFAFGFLANRIGAKRAIYLGLCVYMLISIGGYFIQEAWHFWLLAFAVAIVQGGTQALSRAMFSNIIPRSKSAEFFGFFSVFAKFAGILGPVTFAFISQLAGSSRLSVFALVLFFLVGMIILAKVDLKEGERAALEADAHDFAALGGGESTAK
ncbi:MFS transporter [candidate division KSB1 bacterium]|nr:MFS transporter [candidate division KSB1 bacterium]